jgi:hypothetical protein
MLQRLKTAVDDKPRDNQAGFRQNRSCADHIATLRVILEQSNEFNSSLYTVFIDFTKAFDNLDRDVLWQLIRHYGIPAKCIAIIRNTYTGMQSKSVSPLLFLLAVDWIMKKATDGRRNCFQWTMFNHLDDLDFFDDIALLSHSHQQMQEQLTQVERRAAATGLRINTKKIKVLKSNTKTRADLTVNGQNLEEVDSCTYLGSEVDNIRGSDQDVKIRIGKTRTVFNIMGSIWKARNISLKTKVRLFNFNVKTILLYGAETWKTTKSLLHKLQVFINNCLRHILNIRWPEKISNKELWQKTNQPPVEEELKMEVDRAYTEEVETQHH